MISLIFLFIITGLLACAGGGPDGNSRNDSNSQDNGNNVNTLNNNDNFAYNVDEESEDDGTGGELPPDDTNLGGEDYEDYGINPETDVEEEPISTFSIDVDTGSYSIARRYLMQNNQLPPQEAVRAEEFINYFDYNYIIPDDSVFAVITDIAPSMFRDGKHTLRIGIQGKDVKGDERKQANLVFLIDVSGSMRPSNKLPLIKRSLKVLLDNLKPDDYVGIAVYAGEAAPYMQSTQVENKESILRAIDNLEASGSTNAEGGIRIAYEMVSENYIEGGVNRVILCSDGDANVGWIEPAELLEIVNSYKELGITLSTFGFGMGNYKDTFMEQLANKGDGNYGYIDTIEEAERLFGDKLISILQEIARDVKIQIEFNPETVDKYRLVGYENRKLDKEDFRDDTVDAGEIGALHSVTAVYELTLQPNFRSIEDILYEIRLRWKNDTADKVFEVNNTLDTSQVRGNFMSTSPYFRLAISVAEFAELLRGSPYATGSSYKMLIERVSQALSELEKKMKPLDKKFYELLEMIQKADYLSGDDGEA
jgi:Ca-activated chloride channel family protein